MIYENIVLILIVFLKVYASLTPQATPSVEYLNVIDVRSIKNIVWRWK